MAEFPRLRTGAIAQYPLERRRLTATRVLRFLDGREQRFLLYRTPMRRWVVQLDLLDEQELAMVDRFLAANRGRAGTFAFHDPWDNTDWPTCRFEEDEAILEMLGQQHGRTTLTIQEQR